MNDKLARIINLTLTVALIVVIGLICAVALAGILNAGSDAILIAGLGWAGY
jgi:hypothetical protein